MKILVVDDHAMVRDGARVALHDMDPECEILEAGCLARVEELFAGHDDIQLVLLDLSITDSTGVTTLKKVRGYLEGRLSIPRIVIVSGSEDVDLIDSILNEHATGFIPKGVGKDILKNAISLTLAGGVYIPEIYLSARRASPLPLRNQAIEGSVRGGPFFTETEQLISAFLVQGLTLGGIALAVSRHRNREMSELTVKTHIKNIANKLNIQGEGKTAVLAEIGRLGLKFPLS